MKFKVLLVSVFFIFILLPGISLAQNKVVVVPLIETPTGSPAPVGKTGATAMIGYTLQNGEDGKLKKGVAWPNPRFKDNGNGTVADNLTGLIWLTNANCIAFYSGDTIGQNDRPWTEAIVSANSLGNGYCGLADGSSAGDWRLPNRFELESLLHLGFENPVLSDASGSSKWTQGNSFINVESLYWSSTTYSNNYDIAWIVDFFYGYVRNGDKEGDHYNVWPVRGGK